MKAVIKHSTCMERNPIQMNSLLKFVASLFVFLTLILPATLFAQQDQSSQGTVVVASNSLKKIGYRASAWKTFHSADAEDAKSTIATLKKLGCEVTSENHGNHVDVKFRCVNWISLDLATDQLVNQWSTWMAARGLETVIVNPPSNTQKSTVKFRMPTFKTVHMADRKAANKIVNTMKLIGCEVESFDHDGHLDLAYRCPEWQTIELPSDAHAKVWKKWLDESGFETQPNQ
ncbi:MAG: hypothetical protein AAF939_18565 [Planctomycetota bacterium]